MITYEDINKDNLEKSREALYGFAYGEHGKLPEEQDLRKAIDIAIFLCEEKLCRYTQPFV